MCFMWCSEGAKKKTPGTEATKIGCWDVDSQLSMGTMLTLSCESSLVFPISRSPLSWIRSLRPKWTSYARTAQDFQRSGWSTPKKWCLKTWQKAMGPLAFFWASHDFARDDFASTTPGNPLGVGSSVPNLVTSVQVFGWNITSLGIWGSDEWWLHGTGTGGRMVQPMVQRLVLETQGIKQVSIQAQPCCEVQFSVKKRWAKSCGHILCHRHSWATIYRSWRERKPSMGNWKCRSWHVYLNSWVDFG